MAEDSNKDIWKELRKPFPKESIGQMSRGGAKLDFVGHAAVTDRLNNVVGPWDWNWEPLSVDENGLPRLDSKGNLWIKLTIHGVTRLGYGDGSSSIKELIGDALRNAAMRFGVALDLWSKEELESTLDDPSLKNDKPSARPSKPAVGSDARSTMSSEVGYATEAQVKLMLARARDASGLIERQDILDFFVDDVGKKPNEVKRSEVEGILQRLSGGES
jgi:hypothetical protein